MQSVKRMDVREFRERGYLQEINRRLLHPLGLAIEVVLEHGQERLGGVWDYRDDPEGVHYGFALPDSDYAAVAAEKCAYVEQQLAERGPAREASLGFVIEPVPAGVE